MITIKLTEEEARLVAANVDGWLDAGACKGGLEPDEKEALRKLYDQATSIGKRRRSKQATATHPSQPIVTQAEAGVSEERGLTVTPAMVKAAMPWLTNLHHMRKTDKESNVEEAIKAALTTAQPATGGKP